MFLFFVSFCFFLFFLFFCRVSCVRSWLFLDCSTGEIMFLTLLSISLFGSFVYFHWIYVANFTFSRRGKLSLSLSESPICSVRESLLFDSHRTGSVHSCFSLGSNSLLLSELSSPTLISHFSRSSNKGEQQRQTSEKYLLRQTKQNLSSPTMSSIVQFF